MKGNEMLNCPACAGPTALGGDCATCRGITQVTQEIYNDFVANQIVQNELFALQTLIIDALESAINTYELKQAITELISN